MSSSGRVVLSGDKTHSLSAHDDAHASTMLVRLREDPLEDTARSLGLEEGDILVEADIVI